MAPPFWRRPAEIGIFWIFRQALNEDFRFVDSDALSEPDTAPDEGFRPL
jgi:hypothetical protein